MIVKQLARATTPEDVGELLFGSFGSAGVEQIVVGALPGGGTACRGCDKPLSMRMRCDGRSLMSQGGGHYFFRFEPAEKPGHRPYGREEPPRIDALETLVFSVGCVNERIVGLSFHGDKLNADEIFARAPALVANYAVGRLLELETARCAVLTERQRAVLQWAAEGKTDKEIGMILGMSEHTVDKHMRQCRETLDAVNRTAAIVHAMRAGLIH